MKPDLSREQINEQLRVYQPEVETRYRRYREFVERTGASSDDPLDRSLVTFLLSCNLGKELPYQSAVDRIERYLEHEDPDRARGGIITLLTRQMVETIKIATLLSKRDPSSSAVQLNKSIAELNTQLNRTSVIPAGMQRAIANQRNLVAWTSAAASEFTGTNPYAFEENLPTHNLFIFSYKDLLSRVSRTLRNITPQPATEQTETGNVVIIDQ